MKTKKKKAHYLIDEVASMYQCSRDDLIRWGAIGALPIHVLADKWTVEVHSGYVQEQEERWLTNNDFPSSPHEPRADDRTISGQTFQHPGTIKIEGWPVRLLASTLARYEANPKTTERSFYCEAPNGDDEAVYEYRLSALVDGCIQNDIALEVCRLVVLAKDLRIVEDLTLPKVKEPDLNKEFTDPSSANMKSVPVVSLATGKMGAKRSRIDETALKQIGVLAWLMSSTSPLLKNGKKPNAIRIGIAAEEFLQANAAEIEKRGMRPTNFRTNIAEGLKLLLES